MNFRALPIQLHSTAEAVAKFFGQERGISNFKVEEPAMDGLDYRPTLRADGPDFRQIWIEVSDVPYVGSLDPVVLHCIKCGLPVELYVAFPDGVQSPEYKRLSDQARSNGVGVIEVSTNKCDIIHQALPLSLLGVRAEDKMQFPRKYRSVLFDAEKTYRNGNPVEACLLIYKEIEGISRRLAAKIAAKNWWKSTSIPAVAKLHPEKPSTPWSKIINTMVEHADFANKVPGVNAGLIMRVGALVDSRNQSGHKPKSRADRIKRDREQRTRFETAVDVLLDLSNAVKSLRI